VRLSDLAERLSARLVGRGEVEVFGLRRLELATPSDVSFFTGGARYARQLRETKAAAVILPDGCRAETPPNTALLFVADVETAVETAAQILLPPPVQFETAKRHPTAAIHEDAFVDPSAYIGPFCVVEAGARVGARTVLVAGVYIGHNASVGSDCLLWSGVVVRERCIIGNRVIIHANSVIGSDGYGFRRVGKTHKKLTQFGVVVVEDDVEIGACCTIDRARFDETRIGAGTKIDNLVHIAHNVRIGRNCLVVAQVGIAGSAKLGDNVVVAGQAGIDGHVVLGDGVVVAGRAGVTHDVPSGSVVAGYPAQDRWKENRCRAAVRKLPQLLPKLKRLLEEKDES